MKKAMTAIMFMLVLVLPVRGDPFDYETEVVGSEESEQPIKWCPTTLISDNDKCMNCHVMSGGMFMLKETEPDAHLTYPGTARIENFGTIGAQGKYELFGAVSGADYDSLKKAMKLFDRHGITHITMEIYSYGGDLFAAWRIKGLIDEWIARGNSFDTKVLGAGISAAAILFAVGQERIIHAQAELMFHELWTMKFFDVATPSDKEEEARVLRHLQDTISEWLATRCNLSKEELDELMKKKEYWIRGKEALELGFATKLIGE